MLMTLVFEDGRYLASVCRCIMDIQITYTAFLSSLDVKVGFLPNSYTTLFKMKWEGVYSDFLCHCHN